MKKQPFHIQLFIFLKNERNLLDLKLHLMACASILLSAGARSIKYRRNCNIIERVLLEISFYYGFPS